MSIDKVYIIQWCNEDIENVFDDKSLADKYINIHNKNAKDNIYDNCSMVEVDIIGRDFEEVKVITVDYDVVNKVIVNFEYLTSIDRVEQFRFVNYRRGKRIEINIREIVDINADEEVLSNKYTKICNKIIEYTEANKHIEVNKWINTLDFDAFIQEG